MKVFVPEAAEIPKWYGIAYRDFSRMGAVCYPIPLNWPVRWARSIWILLRIPGPNWVEEWDGAAYAEGLRQGKLIGYRQGQADGFRYETRGPTSGAI